MQWFKGQPTKVGWYFYAPSPKDWDLARPVPVRRVDEPGMKPSFTFLSKPDSMSWESVENLKGIWLGPIEFPEPHPAQQH